MKKLSKEKFQKKYIHCGYSFLDVPYHWEQHVRKAIVDIEKVMWPQWMPFWLKHIIHWLACKNHIYKTNYYWAENLRAYLTNSTRITQIKDKYGGLRIYGYFNDEIDKIVEEAEKACDTCCERCGVNSVKVQTVRIGSWYWTYCPQCTVESAILNHRKEERKQNG